MRVTLDVLFGLGVATGEVWRRFFAFCGVNRQENGSMLRKLRGTTVGRKRLGQQPGVSHQFHQNTVKTSC